MLQASGTTPMMNYNGKIGGVRRFVLVDRGVRMDKAVATYSCGNPLCVHPDHIVKKSRSFMGKRSYNDMPPVKKMARRNNIQKYMRTEENTARANAIRDAEGSQSAIAKQYGVSQSFVSMIKRGVRFAIKNPLTQWVSP